MSDYKPLFERLVALQNALLDAQQDIRQALDDAKAELIGEGTSKEDAKRIRAELAELKALALIEARGEEARRKVAEKIARREELAGEVGVQLAFDGIGAPVRMARATAKAKATGKRALNAAVERLHAMGAEISVTPAKAPPPINEADRLFREALDKEGFKVDPDTGEITAPPPASDAEALAEIGARVAAEAEGRPIDAPVMAAPAEDDWLARRQGDPLLGISGELRRW